MAYYGPNNVIIERNFDGTTQAGETIPSLDNTGTHFTWNGIGADPICNGQSGGCPVCNSDRGTGNVNGTGGSAIIPINKYVIP